MSDEQGGAVREGMLALFLAQRAALLRYLKARRAAVDEAEDVLQDLYLKLERQRPGPIAEPRAYLYRMAENLLRDRRRAAGRRSGREEAWTQIQQLGGGEADPAPSPERQLEARQRLRLLEAELAALPERTLHVLRRFRIDGVAQRAIADELGISLSAVEKHLQKAYQALLAAQQRLDAAGPLPQRHGEER